VGAVWLLARVLVILGRVAAAQHDFVVAWSALTETIELSRRVGNPSNVAAALHTFAYLACTRGQFQRAVVLAVAAEAVHGSVGGALPLPSPRMNREIEAVLGGLPPAIFAAARSKGQALALDEAIAYAVDEEGGPDTTREAVGLE
jgi:hypothetical protein